MAMSAVRAVLLQPDDDVAAVLETAAAHAAVAVTLGTSGKTVGELALRQEVPFGHKVAVRDIGKGKPVHRYGFPIGIATVDINQGEHVHSHNMRSMLSPVAKQHTKPSILRPAQWVHELVKNSLQAVGASAASAEAMADAITEAHLRGVETHGLRRLRPYIARIRSGGVDCKSRPQVRGNNALISIDGCNGIGH